MQLEIEHARKVLKTVDAGLCRGKGIPKAGKMCVEAAVCFALGLPHSDEPPCVGNAVRAFKIPLNDSGWSSDEARARGMRRIAIAQLGSDSIDQNVFVKELALATVRKIVPLALRGAAKIHPDEKHRQALEAEAMKCESAESAESAARGAESAARSAWSAARSLGSAARSAAWSAARSAWSAARSAESAARGAAGSAESAARSAESAESAESAARSAESAARDEVLTLMAEIGVESLQKAGSPGCQWLHICD